MALTIEAGSYPQISGIFGSLSGLWTEKDLEEHGHKLVELRIKEITIVANGGTRTFDEVPKYELGSLGEFKNQLKRSTWRRSNQLKASIIAHMGKKMTVKKLERAIRETVVEHEGAVSHGGGYKMEIIVDTLVTFYNGKKCWWARVDKNEDGVKMILVQVGGKRLAKMSAKELASYMDYSWDCEICDVKGIAPEYKPPKPKPGCFLSGKPFKQ